MSNLQDGGDELKQTSPPFSLQFLTLGHVTRDLHPDGSFSLGGTVTFAALAAYRLGLATGIVTCASTDLILELSGVLPNIALDPAEVHYAAVWQPAPGELAAFPNLRVIFNLGAGVDALMADSSLPKVPLVRVAVADLTDRMTEYVVLHVLMHHRQEPYLGACQREKRWQPRVQWPASAISVRIRNASIALTRYRACAIYRRMTVRFYETARGGFPVIEHHRRMPEEERRRAGLDARARRRLPGTVDRPAVQGRPVQPDLPARHAFAFLRDAPQAVRQAAAVGSRR